jgi:hypothetical protein
LLTTQSAAGADAIRRLVSSADIVELAPGRSRRETRSSAASTPDRRRPRHVSGTVGSFDLLTRLTAASQSRRQALRLLLSTVVAAVVAACQGPRPGPPPRAPWVAAPSCIENLPFPSVRVLPVNQVHTCDDLVKRANATGPQDESGRNWGPSYGIALPHFDWKTVEVGTPNPSPSSSGGVCVSTLVKVVFTTDPAVYILEPDPSPDPVCQEHLNNYLRVVLEHEAMHVYDYHLIIDHINRWWDANVNPELLQYQQEHPFAGCGPDEETAKQRQKDNVGTYIGPLAQIADAEAMRRDHAEHRIDPCFERQGTNLSCEPCGGCRLRCGQDCCQRCETCDKPVGGTKCVPDNVPGCGGCPPDRVSCNGGCCSDSTRNCCPLDRFVTGATGYDCIQEHPLACGPGCDNCLEKRAKGGYSGECCGGVCCTSNQQCVNEPNGNGQFRKVCR